MRHMDFARNTAAKTARDLPIEVDDAIQVGYEGLVQAAARFDVEKFDPHHKSGADFDTNFKSFAYPRIRGAVIDKSRSDNFVKRRGLEKGLHFHMESIDERREGEFGTDMPSPSVQLEALSEDPDLKIDFLRALKTLNDREQYIVLSLMVGKRGHDLVEELGISDSRVSQLAAEARTKLAAAMDIDWSEAA